MNVVIIGCGYVGLALGRVLVAAGHAVAGMRRSSETDSEMRMAGITPIHADITEPASLARIAAEYDVVVNLVSSNKGGAEEYRRVYLKGTRNLIDWMRSSPPRVYLYTSSTSVYAQTDGSWVTEDSAAEPDSATSQVLIETERELLHAHQHAGFPAIILRPSGIYGPGRGHLFHQYLQGEATMRGDGSHWINMVHVDDLVASIVHLIGQGRAGQIYNVNDDEPVTQREFFDWLAEKLHRSLPPSAPPDPNRKRGLTNKRVSNAKLKSTGFRFRFPTFRDGYARELARVS